MVILGGRSAKTRISGKRAAKTGLDIKLMISKTMYYLMIKDETGDMRLPRWEQMSSIWGSTRIIERLILGAHIKQ
jgi:hypothetical protein